MENRIAGKLDKDEILNRLYKTYGSDSGVLFGIKDKGAVEAIVAFTKNIIRDEQPIPVKPQPSLKVVIQDSWEFDKEIPESDRFLAHINDLKIVVTAESMTKVWTELIRSIEVMIAFDSGISAKELNEFSLTKKSSPSTTPVEKEEKLVDRLLGKYESLKNFTTGFFYWWWNQKGNNTEEGFLDYIETEEGAKKCKAVIEQFQQPTPVQEGLREDEKE